MLHFVLVGGGPTGVECAAELHDLIEDEVKEFFPHLASK
jgi:NADH:ubiquinone reductase (non-electrogenic)